MHIAKMCSSHHQKMSPLLSLPNSHIFTCTKRKKIQCCIFAYQCRKETRSWRFKNWMHFKEVSLVSLPQNHTSFHQQAQMIKLETSTWDIINRRSWRDLGFPWYFGVWRQSVLPKHRTSVFVKYSPKLSLCLQVCVSFICIDHCNFTPCQGSVKTVLTWTRSV